jgi:formylglycine-generating enzyme required for sulfatase activity
MKSVDRPLRVFLCHSSNDKPAVRELYQKLRAEPWIQPWLDEEELFPGMDWNLEIQKAIRETDAIVVCLSKGSITKEGYVQREIKTALDYSDDKPEGMVYIIPIRLEECEPPQRLSKWQYADYFESQRDRGFERLLVSLRKRAKSLRLYSEKIRSQKEKADIIDQLEELISKNQEIARPSNIDYDIVRNKLVLSNGMEFMRVPAGEFLMGSDNGDDDEKPQHTIDIPYDYWMARFPVDNEQYSQFKKIGFDRGEEYHPVVRVNWDDAMEYCQWLNQLLKKELPSNLVLRLPTEAEWEKAARWLPSPHGDGGESLEYPWGNTFDKNKCNTNEGGRNGTTSFGWYSPQGDSPYGCADMSGNVWEWTHSLYTPYPYNVNDGREDEKATGARVLRGCSFREVSDYARCAYRLRYAPGGRHWFSGFRVVVSPSLPS